MLTFPSINPVAVDLGFIQIHWYGITYLIAFGGCWLLLLARHKFYASPLSARLIEDLIFYCAIGVIVGGRSGYMLFYNFSEFLQSPWIVLQIWNGGMSFHGGLIGVLVAMGLFARKHHMHFFRISDEVAIVVPFGLACGRAGNFINAELWGRPSDLPWAMIFPTDPLQLPRHPSMLYEFFLEGLLLLLIMWLTARRPRPLMMLSGLFMSGYGSFRFAVEFVRQPDQHMGVDGFIWGSWLTQGMLLSFPMILVGLFILYLAAKRQTLTQKE